MGGLHQIETIILLLTAVLALTTAAHKLLIPYPILLVIGGLILGLIPGLPAVHLDPDLVFLVFLPPILWAAAYFTSLREFRNNIRPISMLAVGLVLATTAAVAAVAHVALPGKGWAEAMALGAIVSPPDAVSATAIAKRLGIPNRLFFALISSVFCVLIEMLGGKKPFNGVTTEEVVTRHLVTGPELPDKWPEDVPGGLDAVLRKSLAKRLRTSVLFQASLQFIKTRKSRRRTACRPRGSPPHTLRGR